MHAMPARLQHMMLQLQKFDITLVYKKGAELYVADTLSRASLPERVDDIIDTERFEVMTVLPILRPECLNFNVLPLMIQFCRLLVNTSNKDGQNVPFPSPSSLFKSFTRFAMS